MEYYPNFTDVLFLVENIRKSESDDNTYLFKGTFFLRERNLIMPPNGGVGEESIQIKIEYYEDDGYAITVEQNNIIKYILIA